MRTRVPGKQVGVSRSEVGAEGSSVVEEKTATGRPEGECSLRTLRHPRCPLKSGEKGTVVGIVLVQTSPGQCYLRPRLAQRVFRYRWTLESYPGIYLDPRDVYISVILLQCELILPGIRSRTTEVFFSFQTCVYVALPPVHFSFSL